MQRYFITFAYDGTAYHGWQIQPNGNSVQEELQKALSTILREDIDIVGAGRTDAGVHARRMTAHFENSIVWCHATFLFLMSIRLMLTCMHVLALRCVHTIIIYIHARILFCVTILANYIISSTLNL